MYTNFKCNKPDFKKVSSYKYLVSFDYFLSLLELSTVWRLQLCRAQNYM